MELLNGPEFKDIRTVCHETMNVFGKLFIENAKCVLFMDGVANYQGTLVERLSPNTEDFPARAGRNITPSRPSSSIPPHIHEENHTYEQEPGAKLSATIVGWREVKALTHYGVRLTFGSFPQSCSGPWPRLNLASSHLDRDGTSPITPFFCPLSLFSLRPMKYHASNIRIWL